MAKKIEKKDSKVDQVNNEVTSEIVDSIKRELNETKKTLKNELINEIRFEANTVIKDDIREQLIFDVSNEIKDTIRREQKSIIRSKNFKIFRKNIFILILLAIIVYFGYCLWDCRYFKFMQDKKTVVKEVNKKSEEKEEEIVKDKEWYITNYGYLLDDMKLDLSYDNSNIYYLYTNSFDRASIKDTIKLNLAYKFVDDKHETDYNYTIYEDDVKNAYIKLFGSLDNYNPTSFTVGCMQFYYNDNEKVFTAYKFNCDSSNSLHIKEEIKDMYEDNGKIVIETVMGVYSDYKYLFNYSNLYNSVAVDFDESKSVLDYEDKLNTYKYTFNKNDNGYYFESIEKTK